MGKTIIWSFQAFNDGQVHHSKFGRQVTTHLVFVFINSFPLFILRYSVFSSIVSMFSLLQCFSVVCICPYLLYFLLPSPACHLYLRPSHLKGWGRKSSVDWKSKVLFTFSLKYFSLSWKLKSWRKTWKAKPKYNYCVFFLKLNPNNFFASCCIANHCMNYDGLDYYSSTHHCCCYTIGQ